MQPFRDCDLRKVLETQAEKLNEQIERYSNDEIMANDLDILTDNCYEQFYIEPVNIGEEEFCRRSIIQKKIKRFVDPFLRDIKGKEYVFVDGYSMTFIFPFSGEPDLFKCRASTFSLSVYPDIEIDGGFLSFHYELLLNEMKTDEDKEKLMKHLEHDMDSIKTGVSYVNSDVTGFNQSLRQSVRIALQAKRKKIEQFYSVSKLFEVPIKKTSYANTHIPLKRKIQPISQRYNNESNYCISDPEYFDILATIKHNGSTYERTPSSFKSLQEEDIRNLLLASLNGIYQGNATGETFRNNGKTDICIECKNRSAFVAECKIWKGQSKVSEALEQLDSYLTWRDCKTALIYFVRNKDFLSVLETIKQALHSQVSVRQLKEFDRNEFECSYISLSNPGQIVRIRVLLFNLYSN